MNNIKIKNKFKSENGFTMQDLIIAFFIFIAFVGIIATLMYNVYYANVRADLTAQMAVYAVQILEDMDKISYEDAQQMTGLYYKQKFSIPAGFNVDLQISDYGEDSELQDVIKIIDLKISYTIGGSTEDFTVKRLKIKEI